MLSNQDLIEIAKTCAEQARHPGESSDFRRGVREVIKEMSRAIEEMNKKTSDKLYDIAYSLR